MWSFFSRDISKDFQYEVLDKTSYHSDDLMWTLHKAKRKGTGEEVSVFMFDVKNSNEVQLELARSAVKRLKTLRHPSILTYLDSIESDKVLYLATEHVEPLHNHLCNIEDQQQDLYLGWGIFQITRALSFLNNDGNLRHNNVNVWSIFVNNAGEWKLGGLQYLSPELDLPIKILPSLERYDPPEKIDFSKQQQITKCSTDMWGLGCLIWEIYNGPLTKKISLKTIDKIPKTLSGIYSELVGANPNQRPNPADVITRGRRAGGFFKNELVDALLFLEEIQIKERSEKNRFFSALTPHLDHFPQHICQHKILPQLITAYEYGDAGAAVLAPMFKLGKLLDEAEYQRKIVPCVVKLFSSNDRATRSRLLQQLEHFIDHLQPSTVNDQIYPQIANGFTDTNPTIREQTVKSIIYLATKLNYNNLNVEVLKHFSRLQAKDEQGGIRTNTTVCLGKIAQHLHPQIRQKVLISAFIRAMRDPFFHARIAGVNALAATQQYFLLSEVATRILPALCHLTTDPEKLVRDSVFRTIKGFLGKLEKVSDNPDLRETMESDVHAATPSLSNAAATWAGWAVTSVAKFYRSQSDTVKASPHSTKLVANKAASTSLEQPSSSSISTTTSSVTSMNSLEQESKVGESMSDYDEHWDTDNWGDMEADKPGPLLEVRGTDGWDTEDWGNLEEDPESSETWSSDLTSDTVKEVSYVEPKGLVVPDQQLAVIEPHSLAKNEVVSEPSSEETRLKREEKKIQRQKELEARRAQRQSTGPMKLGAKKS